MRCTGCRTENPDVQKFCTTCGRQLAGCPVCGAPLQPQHRFCGDCGAPTDGGSAGAGRQAGEPTTAAAPAPSAERRQVAVLFADLVGFTSLAEGRDPEEVREILTRYFDTAHEVIQIYGGVVEKFIGDAVMAVWGSPTAREDDAERAVRAALDLVDRVSSLGDVDGASLRLRAAVTNGEAAVTLNARGQGMVAGDIVNTAARLQSVAEPGEVLVDETTRSVVERAIAIEDAGERQLRGKGASVRAGRATRLLGQRGGGGRTELAEPPFVGRDEELRLLKETLEATGREGRARLVTVMGVAGIGKSRLAWEFLKYIDGVVDDIYWHQGRTPAYGDGIAYRALAEMVRQRAGIAATDDMNTVGQKLDATLEDYVPAAADREWIRPALALLLGLEQAGRQEREEVFSAWRAFFAAIAERGTAVLVFEELQWADEGLLDFIDHLMEWTRSLPILVVALTRPELRDRRPGWGQVQRQHITIHLEPLPDPVMGDLLRGLVPGLDPSTVARVVQRADGVPLYAVELVRMLLSSGRLAREGDSYVATEAGGALEIPGSLHALIAARLDQLDPTERALLQAGAVLGQSFRLEALAAVAGDPAESVLPRLRNLARRELIALDADPRSPERGQYRWVQAAVREVAYAQLARSERRARHLAAARYLETLDEEDRPATLATHYSAALAATPDGEEAHALAAQTRVALRAAADRSAALHSYGASIGFLKRALDVTHHDRDAAPLHEALADVARRGALYEDAIDHARVAAEAYGRLGDLSAVRRATEILCRVLTDSGRPTESIEALERAGVTAETSTPVEAPLLATLAHAYLIADDARQAANVARMAIARSERGDDPASLADGLTTRGTALAVLGRRSEGVAILRSAADLAASSDLLAAQMRALANLGYVQSRDDLTGTVETCRRGLDEATRVGLKGLVLYFLGGLAESQFDSAAWDDVLECLAAVESETVETVEVAGTLLTAAAVRAFQDQAPAAEDLLRRGKALLASSSEPQRLVTRHLIQAQMRFAAGNLTEALDALGKSQGLSAYTEVVVDRWAGHAAAWLGRSDLLAATAERLAARDEPDRASRATRRTIDGAMAALDGRADEALVAYWDGLRGWREIGYGLEVALTGLELASLVPDVPEAVRAGRESEEIFDRLGARAFVGRLKALPERALPARAEPAVTTTSPPAAPSAGMPPSER